MIFSVNIPLHLKHFDIGSYRLKPHIKSAMIHDEER